MKCLTILLTLIAFINTVLLEQINAQPVTIFPAFADTGTVIFDLGTQLPGFNRTKTDCGYWHHSELENIPYWSWDLSAYPSGKTLKSASVTFLGFNGPNGNFPTVLLDVDKAVTLQTNIDSLFAAISQGLLLDSVVNNYYNPTAFEYTGPSFKDLVSQRIQDGFLTLAFRYTGAQQAIKVKFNATLSITYLDGDTLTTTITNVVNGTDDYQGTGSLVRADSDSFIAPPLQKVWEIGGDYTAESWFAKFTNLPDGRDEKFVNWNQTSSDFRVKTVVNDFSEQSGRQGEFFAYTEDFFTFTLASNFEGYGERNFSIQFLDPWRVRHTGGDMQVQDTSFVVQTTPYRPAVDSASWGVFLQKNPPTDPQDFKPYYSIRASRRLNKSLHAMGDSALRPGDWVFVEFKVTPPGAAAIFEDEMRQQSGYVTKAVVFLQDSATITAVYKCRLHSYNPSSTTPTRYNNQRKIAFDNKGAFGNIFHQVYESNGEIWHVQSKDSARSWSEEVRLSDGSGTSKTPCVAAEHSAYSVDALVVFVQGDSLVLRQGATNNWETIMKVPLDPQYPNPTPSLEISAGCGEAKALIVWEVSQGLNYAYLTDPQSGTGFDTSSGVVNEPLPIGTPSEQPTFPSVGKSRTVVVVWKEAQAVKSLTAFEIRYVDTLQFGSIELANNPVFEPAITPPSIGNSVLFDVVTFGVRHLDTTRNPNTNRIPATTFGSSPNQAVYTAYKSSGLQTPWSLRNKLIIPGNFGIWWMNYVADGVTMNDPPLNPSIGYCDQSMIGRIAYNHSATYNRIDVAKIDGNLVFIDTTAQEDGQDPNLTSLTILNLVREVFSLRLFRTYGWSYPFSHEARTTSSFLNKKMNEEPAYHIRQLTTTNDEGLFRCGFTNLSLIEGQTTFPLESYFYADSLDLGTDLTVHQAMKTEPFLVSNQTVLSFDLGSYVKHPEHFNVSSSCVVKVVKEDDGQTLDSLIVPFSEVCMDSLYVEPVEFDLSELDGIQVYLTVELNDVPVSISSRIHEIYRQSPALEKRQARVRANIPRGDSPTLDIVSLPGNASSVYVRYFHEDEGNVELSVFDALGRFVRQLASGYTARGVYIAPLSTENLPSGLYFVRLVSNGKTVVKHIPIAR